MPGTRKQACARHFVLYGRAEMIDRVNRPEGVGLIVSYNRLEGVGLIVPYNRMKKTFWANCIVQSHEKNFLGQLYRTIARKKLFGPIVSYNRMKKTFSANCIVQSGEAFESIVSYNRAKLLGQLYRTIGRKEGANSQCDTRRPQPQAPDEGPELGVGMHPAEQVVDAEVGH